MFSSRAPTNGRPRVSSANITSRPSIFPLPARFDSGGTGRRAAKEKSPSSAPAPAILPVAEEAQITAEVMGNEVDTITTWEWPAFTG